MRSGALKVTLEKWLHRPNGISFHTVSLGVASEILRCAQNDMAGAQNNMTGAQSDITDFDG